MRDAGAADFAPDGLDPVYPLAMLAAKCYRPRDGQPTADGATLLWLDGDAGKEYWPGYRNFYFIRRYNHSPMSHLHRSEERQGGKERACSCSNRRRPFTSKKQQRTITPDTY